MLQFTYIISDRCLYLYKHIYNIKYERRNYYDNADIVAFSKPILYYSDAENNNHKYYFGLQDNSKSSKTLYERAYRI